VSATLAVIAASLLQKRRPTGCNPTR